MDVEEIVSDLNDHGFEDTPIERKLAVINETVWDAGSREPFPQLVDEIALSFDGISPTPTNAPEELRAVISLGYADRKRSLRPMRLDDFEERYGHEELGGSGDPSVYYFQGSTLKIWPVPAAGAGTMRLKFLKTTEELAEDSVASDIWIPRRFHRGIIVNGAVYKLYIMEDDPELAREFERLYEKAYQNMRVDLLMQQYDENDMIEWYADDIDYD
jgi:hypothetical protein